MPVLTLPRISCLVLFASVSALLAQAPGSAGPFGSGTSFDGPDILGRGNGGAGLHGTDTLPIHVQAFANATYDTSILGYSLNSAGQFKSLAAAGVEAGLGASGRKLGRRSYLGLDYGANYTHYNSATFYNGTNHQLNLAAGVRVNKNWQLATQVAAGTSNRFLGGPAVFQSSEFEFLSAPTAELFDSRSYFLANTTSATYIKSSRQSFRVSGTGATVRRRARGLIDMQTYGASGDWVYRVNRRLSIGASYAFSHYDYTKVFGESDTHTVGLHMGRRIGRDWTVNLTATGTKQSTVGVRNFALDPVIASILGRTSGTEVFDSENLIYGYAASVSRRISRSNVQVRAQRAITPGNGYFLTSVSHNAGVTFSHNFSRDLAASGSMGYNKLTSLGFASGAFTGWTGGAALTYKLTESFGINTRYDWRTFDLRQTTFGRTGFRASAGITYFPQRGVAGLF